MYMKLEKQGETQYIIASPQNDEMLYEETYAQKGLQPQASLEMDPQGSAVSG